MPHTPRLQQRHAFVVHGEEVRTTTAMKNTRNDRNGTRRWSTGLQANLFCQEGSAGRRAAGQCSCSWPGPLAPLPSPYPVGFESLSCAALDLDSLSSTPECAWTKSTTQPPKSRTGLHLIQERCFLGVGAATELVNSLLSFTGTSSVIRAWRHTPQVNHM